MKNEVVDVFGYEQTQALDEYIVTVLHCPNWFERLFKQKTTHTTLYAKGPGLQHATCYYYETGEELSWNHILTKLVRDHGKILQKEKVRSRIFKLQRNNNNVSKN